jgi:STE24 endopeptidase
LALRSLRWFWFGLWGLAVGLVLLLLFATLADRPFDPLALQHFPSDVLERGRQFTREARLAGAVRTLISLVAMAAFCFHPAGAALIRRLEALGGHRLWLGLAAVTAGTSIVLALLQLPLSFYLGYWHEHAYGLSKQTIGAWLADWALDLAVNVVLSWLSWLPFYWCIRRWPRGWWAPAALLNVALMGLLTFLSPLILLPMDGKVTDVTDPQVLAMVQRVADRAGVAVEKVRQIEVSTRTSRVNAMVTGMGATKQVVFYDTLLTQFRPDEIEVVMAHELSHAANHDVVVGWVLSGVADVAVLAAAAWMLRGMVGAGPLRLPAPHAARGLALLMLMTTLCGHLASPIHNAVSRRAEVRADRFALEMTSNPKAFVGTFKKLAAGNPGDVDPPDIVEMLSHSHPSIMNRIRSANGQD